MASFGGWVKSNQETIAWVVGGLLALYFLYVLTKKRVDPVTGLTATPDVHYEPALGATAVPGTAPAASTSQAIPQGAPPVAAPPRVAGTTGPAVQARSGRGAF